jgi:ABC-2 type transport system permease protein
MSAVAERPSAPRTDEPTGEPILGPRALTGDWRRFWSLTFNIAKTDWKLRFYGSALGVVWQLLRPLMLFGVLYVFFTKISHVGSCAPNSSPGACAPYKYDGTQLLSAIVLFTFFAEATSGAVRCVVDHEATVRKIQFPRLVIPISVVLFCSFNLGLNLIVVLIFGAAEGVRPMASWVELPFIILFLATFAAGLAMLLSAAFVYFRDLQPLWEVVCQILFYASPVIIPIVKVMQNLHGGLMKLYMSSPLATTIQQFRHAIISHAAYSPAFAIGGTKWLAIPIAIVAITFVLGFYVFNRVAPHVAEIL